jgi:hypothetical protein
LQESIFKIIFEEINEALHLPFVEVDVHVVGFVAENRHGHEGDVHLKSRKR